MRTRYICIKTYLVPWSKNEYNEHSTNFRIIVLFGSSSPGWIGMGDTGQVHEQVWVDVVADVCPLGSGKRTGAGEHTIRNHSVASAS